MRHRNSKWSKESTILRVASLGIMALFPSVHVKTMRSIDIACVVNCSVHGMFVVTMVDNGRQRSCFYRLIAVLLLNMCPSVYVCAIAGAI